MKCINCGLINPETALRCDCGYDFATQSMMTSYIPGYESPLRRRRLPAFVHTVIVFVGIGPPVGVFASFYIRTALTEGVSSLSARDYVLFFGLLPAAYGIGSIPALGTEFCTAFSD